MLGVGGSALGGSALIGSGAFTRIESQRRVKIEVAEDPHAYLGLDGCPDSPNSSYTRLDEQGHLEVEMSPKNPTDGGGTGINSDSFSHFDDVFQICNQGKDDVCVWIDAEVAEGIELDPEYDDEQVVDFYLDGDPDRSIVGEENAVFLRVGECICVGIRTVTKGLEKGDQLIESDEIVIHADVDCPVEPPENEEKIVDNGRSGISFVAFCIDEDDVGDASPEEFTVTANLFKPDGDPVGLAWESPVPVQTVVLFGGGDFFNFDVDGATAGEVEMGQPGEGDQRPGQSQNNPCGFDEKLCSVKFEWDEEIPDDFSIDFPQDSCFEEP